MKKHPRIRINLGKMLFVNVNHDLSYSLESSKVEGGQNCLNDHDYGLENCVTNVSSKPKNFNKYVLKLLVFLLLLNRQWIIII